MADEKTRDFERPTTYQQWAESQGIPIVSEFSISNLNEVEVRPWERLGAHGAMIVLVGAEDVNNAYVLEISGGGSVKPERHLYEEIVYVLSGRGATTVWNEGGPKRTFEWHEGSLFAIPLNAWHQFFNGQGNEPARFYVVSSAPLVMNLYHNLDFVFNCGFNFTDRFDGRQDFFSAEGRELPAGDDPADPANHVVAILELEDRSLHDLDLAVGLGLEPGVEVGGEHVGHRRRPVRVLEREGSHGADYTPSAGGCEARLGNTCARHEMVTIGVTLPQR